ncbi:MAG: glutamate-1-semialdehyde 2,1-aminomutase, partial [Magnetospirillum sp.]
MAVEFPETETHRLIPGGAHTYSKGDDQFPANAPRYLESGDGAVVWDDKGNRFVDWTMGLRTMTLGYNCRAVDDAAIAQIRKGNNFGRASFIETELAHDLVELIPSAEMVKFAKNGSSVTTAAVKLARAFTGRPHVAFCKDHPFFSYDDWFIGATACDGGIPPAHVAHSFGFAYNDLASLERVFAENPGQVAAVIMEACTTEAPREGFLQGVQALCRREGALFILDEMITGFRFAVPGAQAYFGLEPDLCTFGKGIANGYSVSVLAGRRDVMRLGGLHHDEKRVFLISTTHGAENCGLAAARACLNIFREQPVVKHLWAVGRRLMDGLAEAAREAGVAEQFQLVGYPCSPGYVTRDRDGMVS